LTYKIIGAVMEVHKALGPGLSEKTYENALLRELKALNELLPIHQSQMITYLKASGLKIGLLINFGETSLAFERIYPPANKKS